MLRIVIQHLDKLCKYLDSVTNKGDRFSKRCCLDVLHIHSVLCYVQFLAKKHTAMSLGLALTGKSEPSKIFSIHGEREILWKNLHVIPETHVKFCNRKTVTL